MRQTARCGCGLIKPTRVLPTNSSSGCVMSWVLRCPLVLSRIIGHCCCCLDVCNSNMLYVHTYGIVLASRGRYNTAVKPRILFLVGCTSLTSFSQHFDGSTCSYLVYVTRTLPLIVIFFFFCFSWMSSTTSYNIFALLCSKT